MAEHVQESRVQVTWVSWHLVWIMGLLEGLTVPWVALSVEAGGRGPAAKSPWLGFAVGFAGVWLVLQVVNRVLLRRIEVRIQGRRLRRISPGTSGLWAGAVLAALFAIQGGLSAWVRAPYPLDQAIVGFCCAAGSLALTAAAYTLVVRRLPGLAIRILAGEGCLELTGLPLASTALLGGLYEAVALPVISTWRLFPAAGVLISMASGICGGMLGAALVCLAANGLGSRLGSFGLRERGPL
jgi:hypothetical protein